MCHIVGTCWMQVPLLDTHLWPLSTPLPWPLQATRAVHSHLHYHPQEQCLSVSTAAQIPPTCIIIITFVYIHMFYVLSGVLLDPSLLYSPQFQWVMHTSTSTTGWKMYRYCFCRGAWHQMYFACIHWWATTHTDGIQGEWQTYSLPVHSSMLQAFSVYLPHFLSFHSNCSKSNTHHLFVSILHPKCHFNYLPIFYIIMKLLLYCHVFKLISFSL